MSNTSHTTGGYHVWNSIVLRDDINSDVSPVLVNISKAHWWAASGYRIHGRYDDSKNGDWYEVNTVARWRSLQTALELAVQKERGPR